jgi:SPP1 gp7 family putative phage head morphogenesis protein
MRSTRLTARQRRALAPKPPMSVALSYGAVIRGWLKKIQARILDLVLSDWESNPVAFGPGTIKTDASSFTRRKLGAIRLELEQSLDPKDLDPHIAKFAKRVAKGGSLGTPVDRSSIQDNPNLPGGTLRRVIGISSAELGVSQELVRFRERNVGLIKSLADKQLEDIEELLTQAESGAWRVEELQTRIQERFGVSESKANLLARDQVLKLNGQLTKLRQTNAGITKYIWTTSRDERVRPDHADLDGAECLWSSPPVVDQKTGRTGHPGDDFQCRCIPFPILNELDEEDDDE